MKCPTTQLGASRQRLDINRKSCRKIGEKKKVHTKFVQSQLNTKDREVAQQILHLINTYPAKREKHNNTGQKRNYIKEKLSSNKAAYRGTPEKQPILEVKH